MGETALFSALQTDRQPKDLLIVLKCIGGLCEENNAANHRFECAIDGQKDLSIVWNDVDDDDKIKNLK